MFNALTSDLALAEFLLQFVPVTESAGVSRQKLLDRIQPALHLLTLHLNIINTSIKTHGIHASSRRSSGSAPHLCVLHATQNALQHAELVPGRSGELGPALLLCLRLLQPLLLDLSTESLEDGAKLHYPQVPAALSPITLRQGILQMIRAQKHIINDPESLTNHYGHAVKS